MTKKIEQANRITETEARLKRGGEGEGSGGEDGENQYGERESRRGLPDSSTVFMIIFLFSFFQSEEANRITE